MPHPKHNQEKKVIPKLKTRDIIGFTREEYRNMSLEEKNRRGLLLWNGRMNDYRYYHGIGLGGSFKEESWNRKKYQHNCCKSKVAWRHRTGCPARKENSDFDDLSDLKDLSS